MSQSPILFEHAVELADKGKRAVDDQAGLKNQNAGNAVENRSMLWARQSSVLSLHKSPTGYVAELVFATLSVLVHLAATATDIVLIYQYSTSGIYAGSAAGLFVLHMWQAVTNIVFDYMNRGRWRYFLLDLFQVRVALEYGLYLKDYAANRSSGKVWTNSHFRAASSFESFLGALPSIVIQTSVLINDVYRLNRVPTIGQWAAIVAAGLVVVIELWHKFKYVSVHPTIYALMLVKALYMTSVRTFLGAMLALNVRGYVIIWAFVSYLLGVTAYVFSVRHARRKRRDDPIRYWQVHALLANLVAQDMIFCAFPFAPSHAIQDWWYGYLLSETKLQFENTVMFIAFIVTYNVETSDQLFYVGCFFAGIVMISHYALLCVMHMSVEKHLDRRNVYSGQMIVRLFASFVQHTHKRLDDEKNERLAKELLERQKRHKEEMDKRQDQIALERELKAKAQATKKRRSVIEGADQAAGHLSPGRARSRSRSRSRARSQSRKHAANGAAADENPVRRASGAAAAVGQEPAAQRRRSKKKSVMKDKAATAGSAPLSHPARASKSSGNGAGI